MSRRFAGVLPTAAAVLFVLSAYAFFGSTGTWEFRRVNWPESFYGGQVEGYLLGQLSLRHEADPALAKLANPYEMKQREGIPFSWDASYYKGKYYLYFSPVPALIFTLPFKLVGKGYPSDALTMTFFAMWAFLASVVFLGRALRHIEAVKHVPFPVWVLLAGVGNAVPFTLSEVRVYEVAVACGMAMSAMWAYTLLRFLERPSWRTAALMGLFLALTVATRPNMIVLIAVAAVAMFLSGARRTMIAAAIPLFVIGSAYAIYNYQRFGSPFETGLAYQLTTKPMLDETPCSLCSAADFSRFMNTLMHYVFYPPKFVSTFPFADLRYNGVDPATSFPARSEQIGGIGALTPLSILGSALALLLVLARRVRDTGTRAAFYVLAAAWIAMLTLSTCRWVTGRYSLDFAGLMLLGAILGIEQGLTFLREAGVSIRPLRVLVVLLAVYSIVTCVLLGFAGPRMAFKNTNTELFERLEKRF
ncbi:MAG TPA: hypothetical protein VE974_22125 [Thermoanaerobaculia bacterium]|nr:hypothetical protein [Thermoanaerobaculia bacterium]